MNRSPIFLAAYRESGNVMRAARAAGINPKQHYRRLKRDPAYAAAFERAQKEIEEFRVADGIQRARELEAKVQELEDAVWDRALNGIDEPVIFKGNFSYPLVRGEKGRWERSKKPVTVRKFETAREAFLLRGAKPEKYRERFDHSVTATVEVSKFKGSMAELLATFRELTQGEEEK